MSIAALKRKLEELRNTPGADPRQIRRLEEALRQARADSHKLQFPGSHRGY